MSSFASDDDSEIKTLDGTVVNRTQREPDTSVTVSIVRTVAEEKGVVPAELPVLSDVVDPEALDDLVTDVDRDDRTGVRVSFQYCGYTVIVTADSVTLLSD